MTIQHTCTEDLGLVLVSPAGTRYPLLAPSFGNCTKAGATAPAFAVSGR